MRHSSEPVVGSIEAEQNHAEQSQQIGFLAKSLAEALGTDDYQGKHYRMQVGEEALKIIGNDGRGIVFSQSANQVDSKLEQRDFQRFAQITQTMTVGEGEIAAVPSKDELSVG
jgi:cobalamin biosynthesis protein CbiD